jgi:hypothetical protein
LGKLRDTVWDWVWPSVGSPGRYESDHESAAHRTERDAVLLSVRSAKDPEAKKAATEALKWLLERAETRVESVEDRLRTLMALAAVAAAITFGTGLSKTAADAGDSLARTVLAVAAAYSVLQLLCAFRAALRGLERMSILEPSPADLLLREGEADSNRYDRLAELWFDIMDSVREAGNHKVEQMAVAHRALRNFVLAVFVASIALVIGQLGWTPPYGR